MSKASSWWKDRYKTFNRENSCAIVPRKDLTLKGYRKWRRHCNTYIRGMKQHDKCMKGVRGND